MINMTWEKLGKIISLIFPIATSIKMPYIKGDLFSSDKEFDEAYKGFLVQIKARSYSKIEWGRELHAKEVDGVCIKTNHHSWLIVIRENRKGGKSLEQVLIHEIAHVYEDLMILTPGVLTEILEGRAKPGGPTPPALLRACRQI
jgi:hypothetical protein